jgi:GGDEF domain-containing protein
LLFRRTDKLIKSFPLFADPLFAGAIGAMISILKTMSDLDECRQERDRAFDCYLAAIRNISHYAIEFDDAITVPHRKYLVALAGEISKAQPEVLEESRATLRGLLRDYRDKASHCLSELRDQLAGTACALQEIVESLAQTEGSHDVRVRSALAGLRHAAQSPEGEPLRTLLSTSADTIQMSLEQARQEHQVTVAQFQVEIRMLHKRIDALESAVAIDALTKLFTRREMEDRIRAVPAGGFSLLLIKVTGFRLAELNFNRDVAAELTSAFSRRLRNSLPESTVIGRWSEEEFIAITQLPRPEAVNLATHLADHLAGSYACLQSGKTVRPVLQLRVGVVESGSDSTERTLQRITEILTGSE